jgi:hypothetical protein
MHVPGQDLQPVEPVAVPLNIPGGDADLAVLAHGPGNVRAFHRDIGQRQGQIVPRNPEGPTLLEPVDVSDPVESWTSGAGQARSA